MFGFILNYFVGSMHINFEAIKKLFHSPTNEGVESLQSSLSRGREGVARNVRERTVEGTGEGHSDEID